MLIHTSWQQTQPLSERCPSDWDRNCNPSTSTNLKGTKPGPAHLVTQTGRRFRENTLLCSWCFWVLSFFVCRNSHSQIRQAALLSLSVCACMHLWFIFTQVSWRDTLSPQGSFDEKFPISSPGFHPASSTSDCTSSERWDSFHGDGKKQVFCVGRTEFSPRAKMTKRQSRCV